VPRTPSRTFRITGQDVVTYAAFDIMAPAERVLGFLCVKIFSTASSRVLMRAFRCGELSGTNTIVAAARTRRRGRTFHALCPAWFGSSWAPFTIPWTERSWLFRTCCGCFAQPTNSCLYRWYTRCVLAMNRFDVTSYVERHRLLALPRHISAWTTLLTLDNRLQRRRGKGASTPPYV